MRSRLLFSPQARRERLRCKGSDQTTRQTLNGPVRLKLRRWSGGKQVSYRPAEVALGLAVGQASVGFRELICDWALETASFARCADKLERWGLASVCKEKLRQLVAQEGQRVEQAQQQQDFDLAWSAGDACTRTGKSVICLGCDGVMVPRVTQEQKLKRRRKTIARRAARSRKRPGDRPLPPLAPMREGADQGWKEMKLVGVYDPQHQHRHWRVTHQDHHKARILMGQASRRTRLGEASTVVAVVDGAPWIAARLKESVPQLQAIILDWYHLSEHVHAAKRASFSEADAAGNAWAQQILSLIYEHGFDAFDKQLSETIAKRQAHGAGIEGLLDLQRYVRDRTHMVDYPRYIKAGWPIGSGPTESMAGVLTQRVKGPGKRWDGDNAQAMMALAALHASDESSGYWQHQRKKAA